MATASPTHPMFSSTAPLTTAPTATVAPTATTAPLTAAPLTVAPLIPMPQLTYLRTENGKFICPTCGVTKDRQNSMHYHMKKHQEAQTHNCPYCHKSFLQKQTLDLHLRNKHADQLAEEIAPPAFSCPFQGCEFHSHTKGNCVIHCLRVHFQEEITPHLQQVQDRRVYSCLHCQNEFQSTTAFYYHIKNCITFDKTTPKYQRLQQLLAL